MKPAPRSLPGFHLLGALLLLLSVWSVQAQSVVARRVLELDGQGSYLELPDNIFSKLTEGTIETWVNCRFDGDRVWCFGGHADDLGLSLDQFGFYINRRGNVAALGRVNVADQTPIWRHLAAVSGPGGMKLYLDGVLLQSNSVTASFNTVAGTPNRIGAAWEGPDRLGFLNGRIGEFRVWQVARTPEQIRATMFQGLTGREPGLFGLWNFAEVENGVVKDSGPNGFHGKLVGNARVVEAQLPAGVTAAPVANVLDLDGNESYVELPPKLFTNQVVTVEGWVKWRRFTGHNRFFALFDAALQFNLLNREVGPDLLLEHYHTPPFADTHAIQVPNVLSPDRWVHLAVVARTNSARLYVDGSLVSETETPFFFRPEPHPIPQNLLGHDPFKGVKNIGSNRDLDGQMSEVRLWAGERTAAQIRDNRFARLSDREEGLLALWNFSDGTARDASTNGRHGILRGNARVVPAGLPAPTALGRPAIVYGRVTDESGQPLAVRIEAQQDGERRVDVRSRGEDGTYLVVIYAQDQPVDLMALAFDDRDCDWKLGLKLEPGERREVNFVLKPALHVPGSVHSLDTNQPLSGILVQAMRVPPVTDQPSRPETYKITDAKGGFDFVNLRPGTYWFRCHVAGGVVDRTNHVVVGEPGALTVRPGGINVKTPAASVTIRDAVTEAERRKQIVETVRFEITPPEKGLLEKLQLHGGVGA